MAETAIAPEIGTADDAEAALKAVAMRHHEQERKIAELEDLLQKAEDEIIGLIRRAEVAEKKLAAIDGIVNSKLPPAPLASIPFPEQQTATLKNNPLADSFVL